MDFLDISSLDVAYWYAVKIEQNIKQKMRKFWPRKPSQQKLGKCGPNPQKKGQRKYGQYQDNQSKLQANKDTIKTKKYIEKWCDFHKSPWHNIADYRSKKSLVAKVKASKSDVGFDSELEPERRRQIINAEPNATVATTNL